jgi:hypothetical protein
MNGKSKAATPGAYLAELAEPRKGELTKLHRLIRKAAPKLAPTICAGMIGYGMYHYKYASGREGDWPLVGLASQKSYISLYVCATDGKRYLAEQYKAALPKASIGKSCVRFKRLDDVDLGVVERLVKQAAEIGFNLPGAAAGAARKRKR